jgi:hypothetical protein
METRSLESDYVPVDKDDVAVLVAPDVVFLEARIKDDVMGNLNNLNEVVSLPRSPGLSFSPSNMRKRYAVRSRRSLAPT